MLPGCIAWACWPGPRPFSVSGGGRTTSRRRNSTPTTTIDEKVARAKQVIAVVYKELKMYVCQSHLMLWCREQIVCGFVNTDQEEEVRGMIAAGGKGRELGRERRRQICIFRI